LDKESTARQHQPQTSNPPAPKSVRQHTGGNLGDETDKESKTIKDANLCIGDIEAVKIEPYSAHEKHIAEASIG